MHAGQIVRSARKAANMTLAELGERCGYSAAQISWYERGVTRLTVLRESLACGVMLHFSYGTEVSQQFS